MDCTLAQRELLSLPETDLVPEPVGEHLQGCADCRAWLGGLRRLDRLLPRLPVPSSDPAVRVEFVRSFHADEPLQYTLADRRRPNRFWQRWTAGVAAALLLATSAVILYRTWPAPQPAAIPQAPGDPILARLMHRHVSLASAESTAQRVEQLAKLAGDLGEESQILARVAPPKDLEELAQLYEDVVNRGVLPQAGELPGEERAMLTAVADELAQTSDRIRKLADTAAVGSDVQLRRIADTAREGDRRLRLLIQGDVS